MARILIAWELGEAFGHLARCLRLAQGLRQRGHAVVLALKDVRLPTGNSAAQGTVILQAPLTPQHRTAGRARPVNYADMLRHCGFANPQELAARLVAWQGIFSLARPQVLIGDHAPTALLAAHLADIPHLSVGTGFAIPSAISPWPSIRPGESIPDETLIAAEQQLDRVLDAAQKALGRAPPVCMRELFGARDVLDTFAELDHYGERPNGRYVGPIGSVPDARRVSWQDQECAKVLAYLRPELPGFSMILQALAGLDAEVLCVAPGLSLEEARRLASRRMRISLAPLDLPPLFEQADLTVSYGNSGFSTQALLAGVPLLMRPRHVEQAIFAHRVEALGAGRLLNGRIDVASVTTDLQAMLHSPEHRHAAQAFRDRHRHFFPGQAIEQTLTCIEHMLPEARGPEQARHAQNPQEKPPACLH
ncbi:MAG: UDP-glucuronosyltransferase [Gammaproteobacteria bacterium]|uniref:glycosyltransferase n=1 Tax=Rhodoferax sp. TaxID=50421 RepID=UPI0017D83CD2|nr:nucleotide disphospho-sugar-binding domain-containing protein [Rhodoferax sp.]MBU3897321.1 UDP-glucuronosyltransferase [Gammaproteobacteria bacterium]MBA3057224.1 glycosyltransferase family 1 protein [Rhodoferax sp.]MBU3998289.1 UDP-glucuronosyltransferase [Gammaproteobacteria bacterium]MBU4018667.1 UDP-glucuronosyltransferase [Gammaproteobacteria bacterium]MBU4079622.1 UDP-glucuronosyltransferase [Gammaproteobacteria bacterium]